MPHPVTRLFIAVMALLATAISAPAQVFSAAPNLRVSDFSKVTSTIDVTEGPAAISSVNVVVWIQHPFAGDLDLALVHDGAYLRLSSDNGFGGPNYFRTRFTAAASVFIYDGQAPFSNDYRPEGGELIASGGPEDALTGRPLRGLEDLTGHGANGHWTLWVGDASEGDSGTLVYWSLEFNGARDSLGANSDPLVQPPTTWAEQGDAYQLPGWAQFTSGPSTLTRITGVLGDDVDMYAIDVCDPYNFSATTVGLSGVDTRLYLFDAQGYGITSDDDDPSELYSQSTITGMFAPGPGLYYLAVCAAGKAPVDSQGNRLWNEGPPAEERKPDGRASTHQVARWIGQGVGGAYRIALTGSCFAGPQCSSCDFDGDGDIGTDQDIEAFFACVAGNCCPTCGSADFNGDGDVGTDQDIEAFFRVLAGGHC